MTSRQNKIRALTAFSKGDPYPLRDLLNSNEKPLFIEYVKHKGLYYLDFDDLVMTEDEFSRYANGHQVVFCLPYNFRNGTFDNTNLPNNVTDHS